MRCLRSESRIFRKSDQGTHDDPEMMMTRIRVSGWLAGLVLCAIGIAALLQARTPHAKGDTDCLSEMVQVPTTSSTSNLALPEACSWTASDGTVMGLLTPPSPNYVPGISSQQAVSLAEQEETPSPTSQVSVVLA